MRVALDTNILVYAEGMNGAVHKNIALDLLERIPQDAVVLPVQTLGELFNVLVRKAKYARTDARAVILNWQDTFPVLGTSVPIMFAAADLATDHQSAIWDAVILATAAAGGCRLLLSEDLQDGFTWNGVTVTNPFSAKRHVLLEALLSSTL